MNPNTKKALEINDIKTNVKSMKRNRLKAEQRPVIGSPDLFQERQQLRLQCKGLATITQKQAHVHTRVPQTKHKAQKKRFKKRS